MKLDISKYIGKRIECSCGHAHFCPIESVAVENGALNCLPELLKRYQRVFVAADENTFGVCGQKVCDRLGKHLAGKLIYRREGLLVPDETAVNELRAALPIDADLVLGVGSGVINDICKYVTFEKHMDCAIVCTAPSMDGYASSGAAMITDGMKVTYTTHPPKVIIADVDIVKNAPMDMIRAGYGDIVGKYSSLNDWRLSNLINGEYFCREIYDLVLNVTDDIRDSVKGIVAREDAAIEALTKALILIGVTLSLLGSTRPGSGSEHHLSHFFEVVGLLRGEPCFIHGTDVAYSTIVTAAMRERICALSSPEFVQEREEARLDAWQQIYGQIFGEITALQEEAGFYQKDLRHVYTEKWPQITAILSECPSAEACREMLRAAGYPLERFEEMYGAQKIHDAKLYGKDLKNRYSVLWLYYALFSGREDA